MVLSVAVLAARAGCSPALGAFAAGMLASASRRAGPIERLVWPLRDLFGAVFFVAVGMIVEPRALGREAPAILLLSAVLLAAATLAGALGAALAMLGGVGDHAPHGGPIVLPVVDHRLAYCGAILTGVVVTALAINFVKSRQKPEPSA